MKSGEPPPGCLIAGERRWRHVALSRDPELLATQRVERLPDSHATDPRAGAVVGGDLPPVTEELHEGLLGDVVCQVRDMVNAPANELTPTEMASRAVHAATKHGFKAEVLEKRDIQRLGMGGLIAVSQGSDQPPCFIMLEHAGADPKSAPYVLIGKGLTFDAGGICIKPAPKWTR